VSKLGQQSVSSSQSEHQVKGRLLLNVVVTQSPTVFELLSGEDQSLLIRGDAFLVLDLCLNSLNGVSGLHIQGYGLASQGLDEDLHASSQSQDQVKGRLLLDVVVRKGPSVFQLFASEDESLLIGRDAFFVLDFGLDSFNGISRLNVQSDGLSSEGLHEDLHSTSQSEDQVESGLLLDVVVA